MSGCRSAAGASAGLVLFVVCAAPLAAGEEVSVFWDGFETADTHLWSNGEQADCEGPYALDDLDAAHGAATIEICQTTTLEGSAPGLMAASYSTAQGADLEAGSSLGIGILDELGGSNLPTAGARMLGLSSGAARSPGDVGYQMDLAHGVVEAALSGFTPPVPWCGGLAFSPPNDPVFLDLTLRTPPNAHSLGLDLRFFSHDFPIYLCNSFDDVAVALLDPAPKGTTIGNVAIDPDGNPLSINTWLMTVCSATGAYTCPLGTGPLAGSGFEGAASSGWMRLSAPVPPDTVVTLRLGIWDSGDQAIASTLLVDGFRWSFTELTTGLYPYE